MPCPCWRRNRANAKYCLNIQVFHISSGQYEGIDFRDSTFVLVAQPEEEYGSPFPYILYSDGPVGGQRGKAIGSLFRDVFGLAPQAGIEQAQLQARITHRSHLITIPRILKYDVASPTDRQEVPSSEIRGYLYNWLSDAKQWIVRGLEYQTSDGLSSYRGTNSLSGSFHVVTAGEVAGGLQVGQRSVQRPDSVRGVSENYSFDFKKSSEIVKKGKTR